MSSGKVTKLVIMGCVPSTGWVRILHGINANQYHLSNQQNPELFDSCLWCSDILQTYLALKGFHRKVDNHVSFQSLLLDEGLETDMTLKGPDTGVDQHVPPQVCRQCELTSTYITLEALCSLRINRKKQRLVRNDLQ